jgi:tetratricopeptide (TPR) repeat protein
MSAEVVEATANIFCCANCGIAALDNVKLKKCACKLVQYCSVECQKNHRPQHKKACKKRLAEIRDDELFTQPDEGHLGECPLCCLTLPLDRSKSAMMACCSKIICVGCDYANKLREIEQGLEQRCPYCREPLPKSEEEAKEMTKKRVEANDPDAILQTGVCHDGVGEYGKAFDFFTKAAELGHADAHYRLGHMYYEGEAVEKNVKKEVYHLEEAAIGGHPYARFNLGNHEHRSGRKNRAAKHWIIAAKQGHDDALQNVKQGFACGFVSKEDYDAALRGHQAAVDATKSEQRDAAEEFFK